MDLTGAILKTSETDELKTLFYHDKCDKYDYLTAVGCGAIAGLVDIFFVSTPDGMLTHWTDEQVDKAVMRFARKCKWQPKDGNEKNVSSAIKFLEGKFHVNYDQKSSVDVGGAFKLSTRDHHLKSLAHSPDIVGLFFSILNQLTFTATFFNDGKLITIDTDTFELQGSNFISKLFCGITNWFGHLMSDVAGSSRTREGTGRGSGIVIPFFELFQKCNFSVGQDRSTLAEIATKVFEEGYDFRHGLAMSIPVALCRLSVDLIWALRHHFYYHCPVRECLPDYKHDDLRIMRLLGESTLCLMDIVDAGARSGGNWVGFFLHLNLIAWYHLTSLALREVCIRLGISHPLEKQLEAFIRIDKALGEYLDELKNFDAERFETETAQYSELTTGLASAKNEGDLNILLLREYDALGLDLPWQGNFDEFMQDKSQPLVFKKQ